MVITHVFIFIVVRVRLALHIKISVSPLATAHSSTPWVWVIAPHLKCRNSTTFQVQNGPDVKLYTVYIPTNHVYLGDVYLEEEKEVSVTHSSPLGYLAQW